MITVHIFASLLDLAKDSLHGQSPLAQFISSLLEETERVVHILLHKCIVQSVGLLLEFFKPISKGSDTVAELAHLLDHALLLLDDVAIRQRPRLERTLKVRVRLSLLLLELLDLRLDFSDELSNVVLVALLTIVRLISLQHIVDLNLCGAEAFTEGLELNAAPLHIDRDHAVVHSLDDIINSDALLIELGLELLHLLGQAAHLVDLDLQAGEVIHIFLDVLIQCGLLLGRLLELLLNLSDALVDVVKCIKIAPNSLPFIKVVSALGLGRLLHLAESAAQYVDYIGQVINVVRDIVIVILYLLPVILGELLQLGDVIGRCSQVPDILKSTINAHVEVVISVVERLGLVNLVLETVDKCLKLSRSVLARVSLNIIERLLHVITLSLEVVQFTVEILQFLLVAQSLLLEVADLFSEIRIVLALILLSVIE